MSDEKEHLPRHMLRRRQQYRLLQTAFVFALIGIAFFGAYLGSRHLEAVEAHGSPKSHPPPFSVAWFMEDPVAFAPFALAGFTALLFWSTARLATEYREASAAALDASMQHTATLIKTERPYVTGGGGFDTLPNGQKVFLVDVANYGKTPALLKHFDVQFETFKRVKYGPPIDIVDQYRAC
ncbi:hypothetical protein [Reyranella soli]|uniref:Uncharacterized protein n=1 Tax=Reyranella soli TaxID=1230389 RepID=A0A512NL51_9HYPH|nr:hypothetical protein [Reyranella soli]GEP59649.1 hypothetical protein RSO01_68150 [Reyranella soli]